jgi:hypothetical protein
MYIYRRWARRKITLLSWHFLFICSQLAAGTAAATLDYTTHDLFKQSGVHLQLKMHAQSDICFIESCSARRRLFPCALHRCRRFLSVYLCVRARRTLVPLTQSGGRDISSVCFIRFNAALWCKKRNRQAAGAERFLQLPAPCGHKFYSASICILCIIFVASDFALVLH